MFPLDRRVWKGDMACLIISSRNLLRESVLQSHKQNFPGLEVLIFRGPKVSFELELQPPPAHFGLLILVDQQAKKEELWWFCTM